MEVFTNEGNVSQDANFRRHLDDNWDSGNREFDKVEGLLDKLKENINGYQEEFDQLKQDVDALIRRINDLNETIEKQDARINDLNETIEKQDARISKLEDAVFNAVYINDTDELPTDNPTISEDINDTHVVDDDNGIIIEENNPSLHHDIN